MSDTQRFDSEAATWDADAARVALAHAVADAIIRQAALSPADDALDFGAGTGLLTLALQPHVRHITGADSSAGMLEQLAAKVRHQGLQSVSTFRLDADSPLDRAGRFDLIASSMTLHHVRDLQALFHQFFGILRPGGRVALADLDTEDGTFHTPDITDVHHLGLDRGRVRGWLEAAGFVGVDASTAFVHRRHGRDYPVFLVTATRPSA
jgi:ubiquinone/menaquinone biosynthesis C-methylase UbiE